MQLTGSYMVDDNKLPSSDITLQAVELEPVAPPMLAADGSLNWAPSATGSPTFTYNPLVNLYNYYKNRTNNLVSNLTLGYKVLPGLELKSSFGYNNMRTEDFSPLPEFAIRPDWRGTVQQRGAGYGSRNMESWIIEPQLSYKSNVAGGKLDVLAGGTLLHNNVTGGYTYATGFSSDAVLRNPMAGTTLTQYSYYIKEYKYSALFGRINYSWQDKYILDFTARRDGSSRFGSENLFHDFGSIGGAWIFTREQSAGRLLPFLSFGKLKVSYGTTGNDQIADYQFLSLYNNLYNYGAPYQNATAMEASGLSNPYLQWEETRKLQAGLALGFMQDRILLNATFNRNRSSNQLLSYTLPSFVGFEYITRNFPALVQNVSWEFTLNTMQIKGDEWSWSTSLNLTIPRNKVVSFPNLEQSSYANSLFIGKPLGAYKTYHFLGVDPATGEYRYADKKGDPTSSPQYPDDYTVLMNTQPDWYGGMENSLSYRGFHLDFIFQVVRQRGWLMRFNSGGIPAPGVFRKDQSNQPVYMLRRWQKPGDVTDVQAFHADAMYNNLTENAMGSDAGIGDASYIRLKNVSLSWQLPGPWQQKLHCSDASLYLHVQNLLTLTGYRGFDPENMSINNLPPLRICTVGVRAAF
jgi:TonB-linked SusC/RagA family outer membrane protein